MSSSPSSPISQPPASLTGASSSTFEAEHVHVVYDQIALDFSRTRHTRWPFVSHFLASLPAVRSLLYLSQELVAALHEIV